MDEKHRREFKRTLEEMLKHLQLSRFVEVLGLADDFRYRHLEQLYPTVVSLSIL